MIDRLWPGARFVCLGSGPSLTSDDIELCRGQAKILAVSDTYRLAPFADVLYACDGVWWDYHKGVPEFTGLKFGLTVKPGKWPGVVRLTHTGQEGFDEKPGAIRSGGLSGFQAIQVAVKLGAAQIILLGYDARRHASGRTHFFGEHPPVLRRTTDYPSVSRYFRSLVGPLRARGVDIVNCSRDTAITAFPRMDLRTALAQTLKPIEAVA